MIVLDSNIIIEILKGNDEVIILPVDDNSLYQNSSSYDRMKLQQESGFAKTIIGSEEEDVWNDLI